jgi:hypothetical protein
MIGSDHRTDAGSGSDPTVVAVVLAGGTGSRLYPASRSDRPKQFLSLLGEESFLERTVSRARAVADAVVVLTRESYADGVAERVPDAEVLVEPAGRDTGPALLYATHQVDKRYDDAVALVLPSDHLIGGDEGEDERFAPAIRRGVERPPQGTTPQLTPRPTPVGPTPNGTPSHRSTRSLTSTRHGRTSTRATTGTPGCSRGAPRRSWPRPTPRRSRRSSTRSGRATTRISGRRSSPSTP